MSAAAPTSRVGDLLERPLRNGISPSSKGAVDAEVLTLSAITGGSFRPSERKAAKFAAPHAPEKTVRRRDLLICRGNGNIKLVGRARRPIEDLPGVAFPDTMIGATFDQRRVDLTYMEYLWDSRLVRNQVEELARSTNGTHKINQTMVENIEVPLPPIEEQRRIAAVLDAADELRAKRREALAKLGTLAQAIFIDMFGDPINNPDGLPTARLDEIFDIARGGSPRPIQNFLTEDPAGVNWIMIGDAPEGTKYITSTAKRIRPEGEKRSRRVGPGDLLLTNSMSFGRPYIMRSTGCIHDGWLVLSPKSARTSSDYFHAALGMRSVYKEFVRRAPGATVKNLNIDLVRSLELPVPEEAQQAHFAKLVHRVEASQPTAEASAHRLDNLFSSLQQRAFRGEL